KKKVEFIKPLFANLENPFHSILDEWQVLTGDSYNRSAETPLIKAENDREAALVFLSEFRDSPATLRVYTKEIERLLLWCQAVLQLDIASLKRDHLQAYQAFLKKPEPASRWCGSKAPRLDKCGAINT